MDHFSVGDSLATGATTKDPRFRGLYLNIPANIETIRGPDGKDQSYVGLWPLAGLPRRSAGRHARRTVRQLTPG